MDFIPTHTMADGVTPCGRIKVNHVGGHKSVESVQRSNEAHRTWMAENPDYAQEWRIANPNYHKDYYNANRRGAREAGWRKCGIIGMTVEHYAALLVTQGGVCAICGIPPMDRALAVDHDHKITDKYNVRGLLCQGCNQRLGYVEKGVSNPLAEEKAYLTRFEVEI